MFNTLSAFYTSDIWLGFREGLIHERTNPNDGFLYDEITGEKILKKWDIVAHHKTPLTMQNVNDYSISLNPDNILLISQKTHNKEHARFGYTAQRKVYYVYGAPCSGKNTFVSSIKGNSDIVVDMDLIWSCITGGEKYKKPDALKLNAFMMLDCALDMVKKRAGRWERAFVISGGARKGERERQIQALGAEPIFIQEDRETCLYRLASAQDRDVKQWTNYINEWFENYQE